MAAQYREGGPYNRGPMTPIVLVLLLAVQDLIGEWRSVDIQRLETIPNYCARVWIEEREWTLQKKGSGVAGTYEHTVRALPLGEPSRKPECEWPKNLADPEWTLRRLWNVSVKADVDAWNVEGRPEQKAYGAFKTVIHLRDGLLLSENSATGEPRVFRRDSTVSGDALKSLEDAIAKLYDGGCVDVIRALGFQPDQAEKSCETRGKYSAHTGAYRSLRVVSATEFDRVPASFPANSALRPRHGVIYDFVAVYERTETRGSAILYETDGSWRLAMLWL